MGSGSRAELAKLLLAVLHWLYRRMMHGSRVSVGWPSTGEVQRPESASTGHGRAARVGQNLARPASAPVLHLDLHRFAPSVTTKPRQAAVPPAARFERSSRPQSASVKHKTPSVALSPTSAQLATLGFTSDAEKRLHRAAKQRALEQEAARRAADEDDHRFARYGPKKSNIPVTDKWLKDGGGQPARPPVPADIARKYAHGDGGGRSGSKSSFFRGRETLLLTTMHAEEQAAANGTGAAAAAAKRAKSHCLPGAYLPPNACHAPRTAYCAPLATYCLRPSTHSRRHSRVPPTYLPPPPHATCLLATPHRRAPPAYLPRPTCQAPARSKRRSRPR